MCATSKKVELTPLAEAFKRGVVSSQEASGTKQGEFVCVPAGEKCSIDVGVEGAPSGPNGLVLKIGDNAQVDLNIAAVNSRKLAPFSFSGLLLVGRSASLQTHVLASSFNAGAFDFRYVAGVSAVVGSSLAIISCENFVLREQFALNGRGASVSSKAGVFLTGDQRAEFTSTCVHAAACTTSNFSARAAVKDAAVCQLFGKMAVARGARGADSFLSQKGLVLNPGARVEAFPVLEIEEDEVRATHATAVSCVDDDVLFYMASRGLSSQEAKREYSAAFVCGLHQTANEKFRVAVRRAVETAWCLPTKLTFSKKRGGKTNV